MNWKGPNGEIETVSQKMMRALLMITSQTERLRQPEIETKDLPRIPKIWLSLPGISKI
jgi:hypothetical protein